MKIKNITPSYQGQHWDDLYDYHINKIMNKNIKIKDILTKEGIIEGDVKFKDNKVIFSPLNTKWFKMIKRIRGFYVEK